MRTNETQEIELDCKYAIKIESAFRLSYLSGCVGFLKMGWRFADGWPIVNTIN